MLTTTARIAGDSVDNVLRDEIVHEVAQCARDVQSALSRIAKFSALDENVTVRGGLRVKLKRNWYKLEWRFAQRDEAKTVRNELANATQRLTTLLVVSEADGAVRFRKNMLREVDASVARDTTLLRVINSNFTTVLNKLDGTPRGGQGLVQELSDNVPTGVDSKTAAIAVLCAAVCAMHGPYDRTVPTALLLVAIYILSQSSGRHERALVHDVAYTATNAVTLLDAMGRRLILPLELCETRELFHATLVNLFSRTNGRWFIDAHRYKLVMGGWSLDPGYNWDIRPDKEIKMSIIVQARADRVGSIQCPLCLVGKGPASSTYRCSSCGTYLPIYLGPVKRLEAFVDDAPRAPQSIEYHVNDSGRFPRARPTSVSGTAHANSAPSRSQYIASAARPEPLSDTGVPAESLISWRDQVRDFTLFSTHRQSSRLVPGVFLSDLFEDRSELHIAAGNGHYACVAELLDHGEDANISTPSGITALHLASMSGHARVVELLLDRGAAIDAPTENNATPLAFAVECRQLETAALLVEQGAMVDTSESARAAVLYAAACANNVGITQVLLQLGLDVNVPFRGEPALHEAIRLRNREFVDVLLRNGADPTLCSEDGETPLSIAALHGDVKVFELLLASKGLANYAWLLASGHDTSHLLHCAVLGGSPVIVATVLQHTGANLNAHFENGVTPLSLASEQGHDEVVEHLLAQGADPNVEALPSRSLKKEEVWKALHASAYPGHAKCIEILLQHGADVNARTEHGDTPLSLALERKRSSLQNRWPVGTKHFDEISNILLSWGAVMDERSSLLLEEIARLEGSPKSGAELVVPGAWCEDAE